MNTRQKQSPVLLLAEVKIVIDSQEAQARSTVYRFAYKTFHQLKLE